MIGATAKALAKGLGKSISNNKMTMAEIGASGIFGVMEYNDEREQGSGVLASAGAAVADAFLPFLLGGVGYMAYMGVTEGPALATEGINAFDQYRRKFGRERTGHAFQNASFSDTEQVHTMRQAGMAIAQRSKYNTQQAMMGNEAKYMMK